MKQFFDEYFNFSKMVKNKRKYKKEMQRVKDLPKDYQYVFKQIQNHMWKFGCGSGYDMMEVQCDLSDLFEGRGSLSVTQADLIESFYALRNDVEVLAQAVYLAELVDSTCPAGMEHDNILKLLLYTMQVMAKGYLPPKLAGRIFEMKYLQYSGFLASADCVTCGEQAQYFDQKEATFYCKQHRSREAVLLSRAVVQALDYVLEEEGKKLFAFRLSPEALKQLDAVLRQYLQMHVGVDLKSRRFAVDI